MSGGKFQQMLSFHVREAIRSGEACGKLENSSPIGRRRPLFDKSW